MSVQFRYVLAEDSQLHSQNAMKQQELSDKVKEMSKQIEDLRRMNLFLVSRNMELERMNRALLLNAVFPVPEVVPIIPVQVVAFQVPPFSSRPT